MIVEILNALEEIGRAIVFQLVKRITVFPKSSEAVKRKYCGSMLRFPYCAISARHEVSIKPYL